MFFLWVLLYPRWFITIWTIDLILGCSQNTHSINGSTFTPTFSLVLSSLKDYMCLTVYQEFGCGHHENRPKPYFSQCSQPKSAECEYTKGYSFTPLCIACTTLAITASTELVPAVDPIKNTAAIGVDLIKQQRRRKGRNDQAFTIQLKVLDRGSILFATASSG